MTGTRSCQGILVPMLHPVNNKLTCCLISHLSRAEITRKHLEQTLQVLELLLMKMVMTAHAKSAIAAGLPWL